jgi:23S rRNA (adenine2030-N6)-methyltransferase
MLGYRHAFHAGNHGDVLKHLVLVHLLDYLGAKDKPYWYIDTHAGAGLYSLHKGHAAQLREYALGIGKLWEASPLPGGITRYLEIVHALNPSGNLRQYPGSPWLARACSRPQDRLWLYELHSTDYEQLLREFGSGDPHTRVECSDGFAALKALLPPQPRRALVMIDPSYELKTDYAAVIAALRESLRRFPNGVYLLWYPMLARRESRELPRKLDALGGASLHATLATQAASDKSGLYGSGVFVINPPYTLETMLRDALPRLVELLAEDGQARFTLESSPRPSP